VGEESDVDSSGIRKSHFEIYLDAMQQCGADTVPILRFLDDLKNTGDLNAAYTASGTPGAARTFVDFTFEIINSKKDHLLSAIFTFGREDLIPGMFISIVNDLHQDLPESISIFKYYLERHIEVDGDHHSHLALEMTSNLCGENNQFWLEAEEVTIRSLKQRIELWNGACGEIRKRKTSSLQTSAIV
jgi:hypothetical protein